MKTDLSLTSAESTRSALLHLLDEGIVSQPAVADFFGLKSRTFKPFDCPMHSLL